MDTFRHWLSAVLLGWAIDVLPEGLTKYWLRYGVTVAIKGMEGSISDEG